METAHFSEILVPISKITYCQIPEHHSMYTYPRQNLRTYALLSIKWSQT
jgi:hypothetical protein